MRTSWSSRDTPSVYNFGFTTYQGLSIASEKTWHTLPTLGVCIDIGSPDPQTISCNKVFVTHGHLDHIGGLLGHMWARENRRLPCAEYYIDEYYVDKVNLALEAQAAISNSKVPTIVKACPSVYELTSNLYIKPIQGFHRIPSQGYSIYRTVHKLKKEYLGLDSKQIVNIKQTQNIYDVQEILEVVFSGDTNIKFLTDNPEVSKANNLILECTGLDIQMEQDKVYRQGHIHLDHVVEYYKNHDLPKNLYLTHFSARYSREEIQHYVNNALGPSIETI